MSRQDLVVYNGQSYGRVACRMSVVISGHALKVWKLAAQFGNQGSWLGNVQGQPVYTQLLGGHTIDHVGAVRVVSIANKSIFERLTTLDSQNMVMAWHIISHPLATNPFPASFLNCKASFRIAPVLIPGNQSFMDWRVDLLTELHAVDTMRTIMESIMRVGLLNIQRHFTSDGRPPMQKRLPHRHPLLPPIAEMPLPPKPVMCSAFAAVAVPEEKEQDVYVSAPAQEQPILDASKMNSAASYMEMTVPLLHEAKPAKSFLTTATPLKPQAALRTSKAVCCLHPPTKLVLSPAAGKCGAMSKKMLRDACSGRLPKETARGGPPAEVDALSVSEQTEAMCRQASGESTESFGTGDRSARRSASGGEHDERTANAWKAAGLHMARSVSESLD